MTHDFDRKVTKLLQRNDRGSRVIEDDFPSKHVLLTFSDFTVIMAAKYPDEDDYMSDDEERQTESDIDQDDFAFEDAHDFTERHALSDPLAHVLIMNKSFKDKLTIFRRDIEERLKANLEAQKETVNGKTISESSSQETKVSLRSPKSMAAFLPPYFKDTRGLHPPENEDVRSRKKLGLTNQAWTPSPKTWTSPELKLLKESVIMQHVCRVTRPLLEEIDQLQRQKEALYQTQDSALLDSDGINQRILELRLQLEDTKSMFPLRNQDLDWMRIAVQVPTTRSDNECRLKWNNDVHPDINRCPFSQEEQETIKKLVIEKGFDWNFISNALSDIDSGIRLPWMVASEFQQNLNPDMKRTGPLSQQEAFLMQGIITGIRVGDYIPWNRVAYFMKGRTVEQLKHHWTLRTQTLKSGVYWTDLEDKVLVVAVARFGDNDWKRVSQECFGRTNRQCRERYVLRIGVNDRKHGNWTPEDDKKIMSLAVKHNFKWTKLQKELPGRNGTQIAARYAHIVSSIESKTEDQSQESSFTTLQYKRKPKTVEDIKNEMPEVFKDEESMDQFLRESRQKLQKLYQRQKNRMEKKPKDNEEADVERQLVEMFAFYSENQYEKKKAVAWNQNEVLLRDSLTLSITQLLEGKGIQEDNPLSAVMKRVFDEGITTSSSTTIPVLPANRTTLRGLKGLLLHRDYLAKKLSDAGMTEQQLLESREEMMTPEYTSLLNKFMSVFLMPAICSVQECPAMIPTLNKSVSNEIPVNKLPLIRDAQNKLIESTNPSNKLNQLFACTHKSPDSQEDRTSIVRDARNILYPEKKKAKPTAKAKQTPKTKPKPKKEASKKTAASKPVDLPSTRKSSRTPKKPLMFTQD